MKIDMTAVNRILKNVVFYADRNNSCIQYAEYTMPNGEEKFSNIEGEDFRAFLRISYANETGSDERLAESPIIQQLHDERRCYHEHEMVDVYHRTSGNLFEGIDYFMGGSSNEVIHVVSAGFQLSSQSNRKFIKRAGMLPQVMPKRTDRDIFELLRPFVNIKDSAFKLFVIWLIQAFSCGAHYCVFLSAERGSGKSLLTHIVNKLVDPSPGEACSMSRNIDDLETLLYTQYLVCFDNIDKAFSKEFSDTFCIAVTGGTVARRKKFYDTDLVYLPLKNTLLFNGIGVAPKEADLAERSLFFTMKKLDGKEIVPERELWEQFERNRPKILWCIFDVLSKAMQVVASIHPERKARLADAHIEMLAIGQVLGISEEELDSLLKDSKKAMTEANLDEPVCRAVKEYMDQAEGRKLFGPSSEVFKKIKEVYSGCAGPLPNTAAMFGKRLNQMDGVLKDLGYRVLLDDTGARYNTITIIRSK